jgi:Reverse transcriptase (RNA-dependent DNA polymerase)
MVLYVVQKYTPLNRNSHLYLQQMTDAKVVARKDHRRDEVERLSNLIRKSLRRDRTERGHYNGDMIEECMKNNDVKGAFTILRKWYKGPIKRPPVPTRYDEVQARNNFVQLYTQQPTPDRTITLFYDQTWVDDTIPDEHEIKLALRKMKYNKAPGSSGIAVEDLRRWMMESEQEIPRRDRWNRVVNVVQEAFRQRQLPERFNIGILVMIPKDKPGEYRGIALLEVLYKLITRIISDRINNNVTFHDAIHGFRRFRGTNTAISELKLVMRSTKLNAKYKPRFIIFLDLEKAYDTLDRNRTIEILRAYGIGPNILHFIIETWANDKMYPRQAGCYGEEFSTSRGVRQGDVMSPTLFNLVVDAVVKHCELQFKLLHPNSEAPKILFYADDGVITGCDEKLVQCMLDLYCEAFLRVGLRMNVQKTKSMIMLGRKERGRNYRSIEHDGMTAKQFWATPVCCERCHAVVRRDYLETHKQSSKRCMKIWKGVQQTTGVPGENTENSTEQEEDSQIYCFSMDGITDTSCPVDGCIFQSCQKYIMRQHFRDRHVRDIIHIVEEGNEPLPRCPKCGIFQKDVGIKHQDTKTCKKFALRLEIQNSCKRNKQLAKDTKFTVFGTPIEQVHEFRYLGRQVTDTDDDKNAVMANLRKAVQTWGNLHRLLSQDKRRRNIKTVSQIYRSIVLSRLLFGSETWIMSPRTIMILEVFHRRCMRFLTGDFIRPLPNGDWIYPSTTEVMAKTKLKSIQEYINERKKHLEKHLTAESQPILDIMNSNDLEVNMEQVNWWTTIPVPEP